MHRYPGGKFPLRVGPEVKNPTVTLPLGLILVIVLCVVGFVATLGFGVVRQLDPTGPPEMSRFDMILLVLFGALVPLIISYAIVINHAISRWLILVNVVALIALLDVFWNFKNLPESDKLWFAGGAALAVLFIVWWLYGSRRMRVYYALIGDDAISVDLQAEVDAVERSKPGWFEKLMLKVGPFLEIVGIAIVFLALVLSMIVYFA